MKEKENQRVEPYLRLCPDDWDPDAHSCRAEANDYGICQWCGRIISGSSADYELHGYDPPEIDRGRRCLYDGE